MNALNKNYGIELEIIGLDIKKTKQLLNNNRFKNWKVVEDFSICGCSIFNKETNRRIRCGGNICKTCEVVSPILFGEEGLATIEAITNLLKANEAGVNETCGFHVHVDARGLSVKSCWNIYEQYAKKECEIDYQHSPSRRGDKNQYILSTQQVVNWVYDEKIELRTKNDLAELVDKYFKLNFTSLKTFGTLEFRQHAGTLDFNEIKNWILFCQNFIESNK